MDDCKCPRKMLGFRQKIVAAWSKAKSFSEPEPILEETSGTVDVSKVQPAAYNHRGHDNLTLSAVAAKVHGGMLHYVTESR